MKRLYRQKILVCILVLLAMLCVCSAACAKETLEGTWGSLSWTLDDHGNLTITGQGEMKDMEGTYSVIGRWVRGEGWSLYNSRPWLCDDDPSYDEDYLIRTVTIQDGITSIGAKAFDDCKTLTSIVIPDSVTKIGDYAFSGCSSLTNITIPAGVTSLGESSFSGTAIESVVIPNGVTEIPAKAFYGCHMTSLSLPDNLTKIGEEAFAYCTKLPGIDIPSGVNVLERGAFSGCSSLTKIVIPDGITAIEKMMFYQCYSLKNITIPQSVTVIGDSVFNDCTRLEKITLPKGLKSIGDAAFSRCDALKKIVIPDHVTSVGNLFGDWGSVPLCAKIGSEGALAIGKAGFEFRDPDNKYTLRYQFNGDKCTGLCLEHVNKKMKTLKVPDGVTCLGDYVAWTGETHSGLTCIVLPDSIEHLELKAFTNLTRDFYIKCSPGSVGERFARAYGLQFDTGKKKVVGYQITNLNEKVDWVISNYITKGMTEREKVWAIQMWMSNNACYDYSFSNYGADGILLKGTGVCDSYAKAAEKLLTRAGLANRYISGTANNGYNTDGHAWNLVRVDGQWYHLDVTWDDGDAYGVISGCTDDSYFLVTDKQIGKNHFWSAGISADNNQVGSYNGNGDTYYYDASGTYQLDLSRKTATFIRPASVSVKKLTIADTVSMKGVKYEVTEIRAGACQGLKKLSSVTIGAGVKTIGKKAFNGCGKLKTVTVSTSSLKAKSIGADAFSGINEKAKFKCPKKKAKAYKKLFIKGGAPQTAQFK